MPAASRQRTRFEDLTLDDQMRSVLVQLAVVSNGTITSYNPSGSSSAADSGKPASGDEHPAHQFYAMAYGPPFHQCEPRCAHRVATTDEARAALIADARDELAALRRGSTTKIATLDDPDQFRKELLNATVGWTPDDVERSRWRTPARLVRRMRIADGRDPESGAKPDGATDDDDQDVAARARDLHDKGMSERAIAMLVDKPKTTVRRYLGKPA